MPVDEADKVKTFYQIVAGDERNMVVLKPAGTLDRRHYSRQFVPQISR